MTSIYANNDEDEANDDDDDDDDDNVDDEELSMSPASSAELRALLARERSRRRAAEDWAAFLTATLDSYLRASRMYDRRHDQCSHNEIQYSIRSQFAGPYNCNVM